MTQSTFGFQDTAAERQTLVLSRGQADFIHTLNAPSGVPFPGGLTARILLYQDRRTAMVDAADTLAVWLPTNVSTTQILWNIQYGTPDGPDVMIAAGAGYWRLYVAFPVSPSDDYLWYFGPVDYRG